MKAGLPWAASMPDTAFAVLFGGSKVNVAGAIQAVKRHVRHMRNIHDMIKGPNKGQVIADGRLRFSRFSLLSRSRQRHPRKSRASAESHATFKLWITPRASTCG